MKSSIQNRKLTCYQLHKVYWLLCYEHNQMDMCLPWNTRGAKIFAFSFANGVSVLLEIDKKLEDFSVHLFTLLLNNFFLNLTFKKITIVTKMCSPCFFFLKSDTWSMNICKNRFVGNVNIIKTKLHLLKVKNPNKTQLL